MGLADVASAAAPVPGFAMVAAAFERLQAVVDEQSGSLKELRKEHEKLRWEHEGFRKEIAVLKSGLHGALGTGLVDAVGGLQAMSRVKSLNSGLSLQSNKSLTAADSAPTLPARSWATLLGLESPRTPGGADCSVNNGSWTTALSTEATPNSSHRRDSAAELRELMSRSSSMTGSSFGGGGAADLLRELDTDSRRPSVALLGRLPAAGSKSAPVASMASRHVNSHSSGVDPQPAPEGGSGPPPASEATCDNQAEPRAQETPSRMSKSSSQPVTRSPAARYPLPSPLYPEKASPGIVPAADVMSRTPSGTATAWYAMTALGKACSEKQGPPTIPTATSGPVPSSNCATHPQVQGVQRRISNGMWELDWSSVAPPSSASSSVAAPAGKSETARS
eukprot:CAMPEP_0178465652 /NCGR_PEP_ID=MMETSP0689_2-20121128/51475_1 /TAXON_ID=160604 /ORGANISM="Amphidinium massartii, Strain CS-259" /LENGTH=391 /DNA_ID=CAMNT_0020092605 /DNA_START=9 /DNA_END=1184 /DNA_ORIENTATION=+